MYGCHRIAACHVATALNIATNLKNWATQARQAGINDYAALVSPIFILPKQVMPVGMLALSVAKTHFLTSLMAVAQHCVSYCCKLTKSVRAVFSLCNLANRCIAQIHVCVVCDFYPAENRKLLIIMRKLIRSKRCGGDF